LKSYELPYRIVFLLAATGIAYRYNMWMGKGIYAALLYSTAYWLGGNMARYTSN